MSESKSPRLIIIVAVAAATGIVVTLLAQYLMGNGSTNVAKTSDKDGNQRIEALEAQVKLLQKSPRQGKKSIRPAGPSVSALAGNNEPQKQEPGETEKEEKEKNPLLEFMKAMGELESKNKVSGELAKLTELLGLNESQQEKLSEILMAKTKKEQAAGILMLSGKASLADLLAADEDNFSEIDTAMAELLSGEQLEDYNTYTDDREAKRIEKKSNEDLDGLRGVIYSLRSMPRKNPAAFRKARQLRSLTASSIRRSTIALTACSPFSQNSNWAAIECRRMVSARW
jgi:hypothetical protein